jgi:hypothetical protein
VNFTEVSFSRLVEVYASALREGISGMFTEAYRTNDGYVLFIEPLEHRMEALANGTSAIRLQYDNDNKTWDEAEFGDVYPIGDTAKKFEPLLSLYDKIREEKKIYYSSYKYS